MKFGIGTLVALALVGAPVGAQQAATVCKDGSTSAASGRGACSAHGGVDKSATSRAKKAEKAAAKATVQEARANGVPVTCGDGTSSAAGRGACSHHGGVRTASAPATSAAPSRTMPMSAPMSAPARGRATPAPATSNATGASGRSEDNDPTGAIAQCKDGLYSHSAHRQGACSRHGGVGKWIP